MSKHVSHSGHSPCPGCFEVEAQLAQAQADMEALQDGLAQYESVRNLLDELQQEAQTRYQDYDPGQVNVLLIRVKQALDALPEHLRGTSN